MQSIKSYNTRKCHALVVVSQYGLLVITLINTVVNVYAVQGMHILVYTDLIRNNRTQRSEWKRTIIIVSLNIICVILTVV